MTIKRRDFLQKATRAATGTALIYGLSSYIAPGTTAPGITAPGTTAPGAQPTPLSPPQLRGRLAGPDLQPMTGDIVPITVEERQARIQKAQRLMLENKLEALILDSGTS